MDQLFPRLARERQVESGTLSVVLRPSLQASCALWCGFIASGHLIWDGLGLLRMLTAWLVADVLVGCIFAQFVALKQAGIALSSQPVPVGDGAQVVRIPYAIPGSPGDRLAKGFNVLLPALRQRVWPLVGKNGVTALTATLLALVCASYLGRVPLAATAAALLASTCVGLVVRRSPTILMRWLSGLQVALAWSLGYLVLVPQGDASLALAALAGLGTYGRSFPLIESGRAVRNLLRIVWGLFVVALLCARQPLPAALVAGAALADSLDRVNGADSAGLEVANLGNRLAWYLSLLLVALAFTHWF